jgi:hypothetical protein
MQGLVGRDFKSCSGAAVADCRRAVKAGGVGRVRNAMSYVSFETIVIMDTRCKSLGVGQRACGALQRGGPISVGSRCGYLVPHDKLQ